MRYNKSADFPEQLRETESHCDWLIMGYPEHFIEDWETLIDEIIPPHWSYAYCVHDHGESKVHVHFIIHMKNPTSQLNIYRKFHAMFCDCPNLVDAFKVPMLPENLVRAYKYLIHDTEDALKKGKYRYPDECRHTGHGFEYYLRSLISDEDTDKLINQIACVILDEHLSNFASLYDYFRFSDPIYIRLIRKYCSFFNALTRGCFNKYYNGSQVGCVQSDLDNSKFIGG